MNSNVYISGKEKEVFPKTSSGITLFSTDIRDYLYKHSQIMCLGSTKTNEMASNTPFFFLRYKKIGIYLFDCIGSGCSRGM